MTTSAVISCKDSFRTWREKARKFLLKAKEDDLLLLNKEYEEVLADYDAAKAAHQLIIDDMEDLFNRYPRKRYSWDKDKEIMEAHATSMGEIERINVRFETKWGSRYQEYLSAVNALERKYKNAVAMTHSYANYQLAMKNLAENTETEVM